MAMTEACCIAAFNADGHLLMGRRQDSGKFVCPGGHLEPGETPEQAAVRECREEVGFEPHDLEPLASFTIDRPGGAVLVHAFRGRVPADAVPSFAGDPDQEMDHLFYVDANGTLPEEVTSNLHHDPDVCLQFLGLVPPQTDVARLERGEVYLDVEDLQKMALRDLRSGNRMPSGAYDYSHLLSPAHRGTYQLVVTPETKVLSNYHIVGAQLRRRADGATVGYVRGDHQVRPDRDGKRKAGLWESGVDAPLRGQGLGKPLYEAWMKHAHAQGQTHVAGGDHSTAAAATHATLAAKHGMTYEARPQRPIPSDKSGDREGDNDLAVGRYEYALKTELQKAEGDMSPDEITAAINSQFGFINPKVWMQIPRMNAHQLKALTDAAIKHDWTSSASEVDHDIIHNPHLDTQPLNIMAARAHEDPRLANSFLTAAHVPEAVHREIWSRMRPNDKKNSLKVAGVRPDMIESFAKESAFLHWMPSVAATALQNPNVKIADVNRWMADPEMGQPFKDTSASWMYSRARPELREALWQQMGPTILKRLRYEEPEDIERLGVTMPDDGVKQLSDTGYVPSFKEQPAMAARFHGLGLPVRDVDPIEIRPGTDRLRGLRDHLAVQPGGGLPTRVLKAQQMDLGVRGDARGFVTAEHVQQHIDALEPRKYVTGKSTWEGAQRHNEGHTGMTELLRRRADTLADWRSTADTHGAGSPEARAVRGKYDEIDRAVSDHVEGQPVFQLGLHPDAVNELKARGVLHAFQNLLDSSRDSSHPVMPGTGIGWVRYDHAPDGIHVDEIQTDMGGPTMKALSADKELAAHTLGVRPGEVDRTLKHIHDVLWGNHHPSDILHEAFQQHLRDAGHGDTRLHHWQLAPKARISGLSTETEEGEPAQPPVHFQHTYDRAPQKQWGYKPSQYGGLGAQTNPDLKGQPTWEKKLQKFGPALDAWYAVRLTAAVVACDSDPMELKKSAGKRLIALAAATALSSMGRPEHASIPEWRQAAQAQPQGPQASFQPAATIPDWRRQVPMTSAEAPQTVGAPMVGTPWHPRGLTPEMHAIAHLESAWGKYLSHDRCPGGDFHTAFGALGFKPVTAHEQYKRSKIMQRAYPGLHDENKFMERFKEDPSFYNAMATNHWSFLKSNLGGDANRAAYGWRWGIGAAQKATPDELGDDDYVRQYSALSDHMKPGHAPTASAMIAKAEVPSFYEADDLGRLP